MSMNYTLLATIDGFSAVILLGSGVVFWYYSWRGTGFGAHPHPKRRPLELNTLSAAIAFLTGLMYVAKTSDFARDSTSEFSLNRYWYSDYIVTCPLIVMDLCFTVDVPYKLAFTGSTAVLLVIALASFIVRSPEKYIYFAIGCTLFSIFFYFFFNEVRKRIRYVPDCAKKDLERAMFIFFGFWPMFPVLWILGFHTTGVISEEAFFIIHAFLDITCKTIFGIFMLRCRLHIEDYAWDELKRQRQEIDEENQKTLTAAGADGATVMMPVEEDDPYASGYEDDDADATTVNSASRYRRLLRTSRYSGIYDQRRTLRRRVAVPAGSYIVDSSGHHSVGRDTRVSRGSLLVAGTPMARNPTGPLAAKWNPQPPALSGVDPAVKGPPPQLAPQFPPQPPQQPSHAARDGNDHVPARELSDRSDRRSLDRSDGRNGDRGLHADDVELVRTAHRVRPNTPPRKRPPPGRRASGGGGADSRGRYALVRRVEEAAPAPVRRAFADSEDEWNARHYGEQSPTRMPVRGVGQLSTIDDNGSETSDHRRGMYSSEDAGLTRSVDMSGGRRQQRPADVPRPSSRASDSRDAGYDLTQSAPSIPTFSGVASTAMAVQRARAVLARVTVRLPHGQAAVVDLREGDDVREIAARLSDQHGLSARKERRLEQLLRDQLSAAHEDDASRFDMSVRSQSPVDRSPRM